METIEATEQIETPADTTTTPEASNAEQLTEKPAFVIDSMDKLTWYLRKVGNLQAEKNRIKAQAATMIAQVDSDLNSLTGHFGQQAEDFTRQELQRKGGKRKSITTLQGTVGFRTQPGKLVISDDDAALVRAHAMHLTTATICTGAYLKAAQEAMETTGELLPGVELMDAREKFTVTFKGDADTE